MVGGVYPELHGYVWGVGYHRTWDTSPRPTDTDTWLVADAGFPRGGGARPGGPTNNFAKFSQKLHEIDRIWTPRGAGVPRAPFRSATAGGGHQNMYSWQASAMYPTGMLSCYCLQWSCGKVMLLHLSVILSTGGGCLADPPGQTPPRQTPPPGQTLPSRHPLLGRHSPCRHPQADTPWADTRPLGRHPRGLPYCLCSFFWRNPILCSGRSKNCRSRQYSLTNGPGKTVGEWLLGVTLSIFIRHVTWLLVAMNL